MAEMGTPAPGTGPDEDSAAAAPEEPPPSAAARPADAGPVRPAPPPDRTGAAGAEPTAGARAKSGGTAKNAAPAEGRKATGRKAPAKRSTGKKAPAPPAVDPGEEQATRPAARTPTKRSAKAAAKQTAKEPAKQTAKAAGAAAAETGVAAPASEPEKATSELPAAPGRPELAVSPEPEPAAATAGVRPLVPPDAWPTAVWEWLQEPGQPPRRLAELAVAEFGPRAAAWAQWLRETYPDAPADGLARLATRQAGRHGLLLPVAGLSGPLATVLNPALSAGIRVLLVLRLAAAYGYDPTDQARVEDLVELLASGQEESGWRRTVGLGLAGLALRRFTRRRTPSRLLLGLVSFGDDQDRLERLAHRAARHYRARLGRRLGG